MEADPLYFGKFLQKLTIICLWRNEYSTVVINYRLQSQGRVSDPTKYQLRRLQFICFSRVIMFQGFAHF